MPGLDRVYQQSSLLVEIIKKISRPHPLAQFGHHRNAFVQFASLMQKLIPDIPLPLSVPDMESLVPLMATLRDNINETNAPDLFKWTNPWMYRYFEHSRSFGIARNILQKLSAIYRYEGNHPFEAIALNNLAFQYQLEGRYSEAISLFKNAAALFRIESCSFQHANALVNYWMCRFSLKMIDRSELTSIENEIQKIADAIGRTGAWFERKPLILLAKIEEIRGNFQNAIHLVHLAVDSGRHSGTRYPEIDRKYLNYLRSKKP